MYTHLANRLLRLHEAADYLGISRSTLYMLMDEGCLSYVKLGKSRRIASDDLQALVNRCTTRHNGNQEGINEDVAGKDSDRATV